MLVWSSYLHIVRCPSVHMVVCFEVCRLPVEDKCVKKGKKLPLTETEINVLVLVIVYNYNYCASNSK